jgi:hypothetical protein
MIDLGTKDGEAGGRIGACRAEYLVACSCKGRGLCPSCAAERTAAPAAAPAAHVPAGPERGTLRRR